MQRSNKKIKKCSKDVLFFLAVTIISIPFADFRIPIIINNGLKPSWIAGSMLVAFTVIRIIGGRITIARDSLKIKIWVLLIIAGVSSLRLGITPNTSDGALITQGVRLLWVTLMIVFVTNIRLSYKQTRNIIRVWLFTAFIISLYMIIKGTLVNTGIVSTNLTKNFGGYYRAGYIQEPTETAQYLIAKIFFLLSIISTIGLQQSKYVLFKKGYFNVLLACTLILALFMTFSLAGVLAFTFLLVYVLYTHASNITTYLKYVILTLVASLVIAETIFRYASESSIVYGNYMRIVDMIYALNMSLFGVQLDGTVQAAGEFSRTSTSKRVAGLKYAFEAFRQHPLFGVGLNNISVPVKDVGVHNGYLQCLAELGVAGLSVLISILAGIYTKFSKILTYINPSSKYYSIVLASVVVLVSNAIYLFLNGNWISIEFWMGIIISYILVMSAYNGDYQTTR